jgi:hypothetical protein
MSVPASFDKPGRTIQIPELTRRFCYERQKHFCLFLLLVLCSLLMQAQITPSQDAYTNTLAGTTNYGTAVTLGLSVSEGCDGGCSGS